MKISHKAIMKKVMKYIFLEVNLEDPEKLHELQNDLPFLPERIKTEKVEKLVAKLRNKTEYAIHIRNLKRALNHGLVLKKGHKVIKFNQNSWLKSYIDIYTDLRKEAKNDFEKDFFKLMSNAVFEKLWKLWEKTVTLHFPQQKKEGII